MTERQWAGSTFGNGWMHKHLIRILKYLDPRLIYLFAFIFIVPVCLIFNVNRNVSYSFYRRRLHFGVLKSVRYTILNHCCFAQIVIDRFAMYAGRRFDVEIIGNDHFKNLVNRPEGFLHLSSHIGNYEIAGYSINSGKKMIHAVVYSYEKESVMRNRNNMFEKTNVSMIALQEDMSHLFEIDKALSNGDIVSFPSDRHLQGTKCISADFLGAPADFPQGPFSVATMRGLDAIAVNVMKEGSRKYKIYISPLPYDKSAPRKDQVKELCASYVRELEKMVMAYPAQWYNFFDFWKQ